MDANQFLALIKDTITIVALLIGAAIGLFVFFQLAPVLRLRIVPRWSDDTQQFLIVRFEVENGSRVRASRPRGRIQVLEHTFRPNMILSHWVPFEMAQIDPVEQPIEWHEPAKVFQHTKAIYPGEKIIIERMYHYPQGLIVIHIGFQINLELGVLGRLFTRSYGPWQQTTTCIVTKPASSISPNQTS